MQAEMHPQDCEVNRAGGFLPKSWWLQAGTCSTVLPLIVWLLIAVHLHWGSMMMILQFLQFLLVPSSPSTPPVFVVATFFAVCTVCPCNKYSPGDSLNPCVISQVYLATRAEVQIYAHEWNERGKKNCSTLYHVLDDLWAYAISFCKYFEYK